MRPDVLALMLVLPGTAALSLDCGEFTALAADPSGDRPILLEDADACTLEQTAGGHTGLACTWETVFRDGTAEALFQRLESAARLCRAPGTEPESDPGVNHPDTYVLRRYRMPDGTTLSVSLKDKSSLERTFVFFRIAPGI